MTNSHPPTALDRDLVLSDEDLAEMEERHRATSVFWGRRGQPSRWHIDAGRLIAEVRRQRTALRQVRAAIEGRTSVNVSVILSALGEQE